MVAMVTCNVEVYRLAKVWEDLLYLHATHAVRVGRPRDRWAVDSDVDIAPPLKRSRVLGTQLPFLSL